MLIAALTDSLCTALHGDYECFYRAMTVKVYKINPIALFTSHYWEQETLVSYRSSIERICHQVYAALFERVGNCVTNVSIEHNQIINDLCLVIGLG